MWCTYESVRTRVYVRECTYARVCVRDCTYETVRVWLGEQVCLIDALFAYSMEMSFGILFIRRMYA